MFTVILPPLRERREDIIPLAKFFLDKHAREFGFGYQGMAQDAEQCLMAYPWPGNVRELENMMERAIVLSGGKTVEIEHLPADILEDKQTKQAPTLQQNLLDTGLNLQVEQLEKRLIQEALNKTGDNKAKAAQLLAISERSLWYKIKKYF
ncbi:hypothetical protein VZ94_04530 [Methylocucumis oryzae]|uniref:Sigma-54 factor interaction domain-containing protein n=1 Tax=Methylocucumis oryzae TaxID=1632867 RepID=A0A0F3IPF2_9GAMM|nr:hypothetical protein VZ94_04530 [Methylocucumis oryzae]